MTILRATIEDFTTNGGGLPGDSVTELNSDFDHFVSGTANNLLLSSTHVLDDLALSMVTSGTVNRAAQITTVGSHTRHKRRASYYVPTGGLPPSRLIFWQLDIGDDSSVASQFTLKSTGDLDLRNVTNSVATGACPMDQWFDAEYDMDGAANQTVWIYTGATRASTNHADATLVLTGALTATTLGMEQHGKTTNTTGTIYTGYLSEITNSETPTPYSSAVSSTANGGVGLGTGVADNPTVEQIVSWADGAAAATGAGQNATVVTGVSAFATDAAATGAASNSTQTLINGALAGLASATGTGYETLNAISVPSVAAAATGAGSGATVDIVEFGITNISMTTISATGSAFNPTINVPSTLMEYKLYRRVRGNAVAV